MSEWVDDRDDDGQDHHRQNTHESGQFLQWVGERREREESFRSGPFGLAGVVRGVAKRTRTDDACGVGR